MAKSSDDIKKTFLEMKANQKEINAGAKELEQSIGKQLEMQRDIVKMKKNIAHLDSERADIESKLNDDLKERSKLNKKLQEAIKRGDRVEVANIKKRLKLLKEEVKLKGIKLEIAKEEVETAEKGLDTMQKMVSESNKLKSTFKSMKGAVKTWGWDKLKSWGVFDMDKEVRNTIRSMGVGAKNAGAFRDTMMEAADSTTTMGANFKDLAKMQSGYSKAVGRSVKLTQQGHKAMADMSEGTGLGAEFAVSMASGMDNFGTSVVSSRDLVQETIDIAGEMGVNSAAASETLQKSLKLAQRFHFKGGVKGLAKMANEAARLKLDMDGIAGMAEKVFRPEGAVEMAAKLQTMGGAFAKMADPMQLMFKARNDFEGFSKDIGKATSEFVQYNKESKTFEVKGGLAADRMREISNMTGIAVEKLQEMATQQKKIETVGAVSPFNFSKEDKTLVAGFADMKDGKWQVNIDGDMKEVNKLKKGDLEKLKTEKESLTKRAEAARTFQDTMNDLWLTIQQTLLPIAQGLQEWLGKPLLALQKDWRAKGFYTSIRKFATGAVELGAGLAGFLVKAAQWLGPTGTLATIIGGGVMFSVGKWALNGITLGLAFNRVASVNGGGGGGYDGGGGKGGGGFASKLFKSKGGAGMSRMGKVGMNFKGGLRSVGGVGAGVLGGGLAGYNEYQENKEMGMGGSENIGRTASKGISAGLGAWGGAAAGAAIGSVVPVIGTIIGGLIGGAMGAWGGGAVGEKIGDGMYGDESRAGASHGRVTMNDGIIQLNPRDKVTRVDDMIMASTSQNQLNTATKNVGGSNSTIHNKFDEMKMSIKVEGGGLNPEELKRILKTQEFQNMMTSNNNEVMTKFKKGGKSPY